MVDFRFWWEEGIQEQTQKSQEWMSGWRSLKTKRKLPVE